MFAENANLNIPVILFYNTENLWWFENSELKAARQIQAHDNLGIFCCFWHEHIRCLFFVKVPIVTKNNRQKPKWTDGSLLPFLPGKNYEHEAPALSLSGTQSLVSASRSRTALSAYSCPSRAAVSSAIPCTQFSVHRCPPRTGCFNITQWNTEFENDPLHFLALPGWLGLFGWDSLEVHPPSSWRSTAMLMLNWLAFFFPRSSLLDSGL